MLRNLVGFPWNVERDRITDMDRVLAPRASDRHLGDAIEAVVGVTIFGERHGDRVTFTMRCYLAGLLGKMPANIGHMGLAKRIRNSEPKYSQTIQYFIHTGLQLKFIWTEYYLKFRNKSRN